MYIHVCVHALSSYKVKFFFFVILFFVQGTCVQNRGCDTKEEQQALP